VESHQQPVWHVVILGALTGSAYLVYWAYKTWKLLKNEAADPDKRNQYSALSLFTKINPGLRTVALLAPALIGVIPFVDKFLKTLVGDAIVIYVLATLMVGIASLVPDENSFARKHALIACGLVLGAGLLISGLAYLPGSLYLISLLSGAVPCAIMQHWLNKYWKSVEAEDVYVRYGFNGLEMVAIIIGASLIGLVAAGLMIGVKTPNAGAHSF